MKRLEIVLIGNSRALSELSAELGSHGHQIHYLSDAQALEDSELNGMSILIEDGTLDLPDIHLQAFDATVHLGLRVRLTPGAQPGLPCVELLCWHGSATAQRLIVRDKVPAEPTGNGRMLRDSAAGRLTDNIALLVSRYSRDAEHFAQITHLELPQGEWQEGLHTLDRLAFQHRYNQTEQPHLLRIAQQSLVAKLDHSFARFGDRYALNIDGQRVSYDDLRFHSMAVQSLLYSQLEPSGDEPVVIGICLPKSAALFAGILAILGHGAVYLPLDPSQPVQRQQYILENAKAVLLLHDGHHPLADQGFPALDISHIDIPSTTRCLMQHVPSPDAPCMALYTSGTTGHPKGVMLSQRNLSHFTAWYAEYVSLSEHSRVLQFSTLSFDSSVIDIFPTLLSSTLR